MTSTHKQNLQRKPVTSTSDTEIESLAAYLAEQKSQFSTLLGITDQVVLIVRLDTMNEIYIDNVTSIATQPTVET